MRTMSLIMVSWLVWAWFFTKHPQSIQARCYFATVVTDKASIKQYAIKATVRRRCNEHRQRLKTIIAHPLLHFAKDSSLLVSDQILELFPLPRERRAIANFSTFSVLPTSLLETAFNGFLYRLRRRRISGSTAYYIRTVASFSPLICRRTSSIKPSSDEGL